LKIFVEKKNLIIDKEGRVVIVGGWVSNWWWGVDIILLMLFVSRVGVRRERKII